MFKPIQVILEEKALSYPKEEMTALKTFFNQEFIYYFEEESILYII